MCAQSPVSSNYNPYHLLTDVTEVSRGASDIWLGIRTGAGGTASLLYLYMLILYEYIQI
jgi:hypothetical protein